ncbi:hypothetical protein M405DRAFT_225368 [Rhizopogon salebrosus TDB-379]|nr:hypothetical protein M405DRAFT_225368 [Rhizopogon salebrosus TDB-379]
MVFIYHPRSSANHRRRAFTPFPGSGRRVLLDHRSLRSHCSGPHADQPTEFQRCPMQSVPSGHRLLSRLPSIATGSYNGKMLDLKPC